MVSAVGPEAMSARKVSRSKVEVNGRSHPCLAKSASPNKVPRRKGRCPSLSSLLNHAPENALYYPGMYRGQEFKIAILQTKFINEDEGFVQEERKRTI